MRNSLRSALRQSEIVGGFGAVTFTVLLYSVAVRLDLVGLLYRASRSHSAWPVDQIILLFVCLSFAFLFLGVRRSIQLGREIKRRERAEQEAHVLARNDVLTGLSNRRAFAEELETAIARARGGAGGGCAVLLIDLDRFKAVNDLHGHAVGNIVLRELSQRFAKIVPRPETIARIGGDEFAVVIEHTIGGDAPLRLAQRLIAAASKPIRVESVTFELGATIGVATCPADGIDVEALLHAADVALYSAKRDERGTAKFFEHSMDVELRTRAAMEADLRRAISTGEIRPYYQPFFDLGEQRLLGFEILARWDHPSGLIMPDDFIPVAEESGMIGELTSVLLKEACREARSWPADLTLALNISPSQLQDRWLPQRLLAILTETGFAPGRLEVEITENALVNDIDTARGVLAALQNVGVRIALDDFGTGYSSLYHLRELKFDKIKIDRSFVLTMQENGESEKIVNAIVGLSKSLGLTTTAEGIETLGSLDQLTDIGCDFGQGYHFGAAMAGAEASRLANGEPGAGELAAPALETAC